MPKFCARKFAAFFCLCWLISSLVAYGVGQSAAAQEPLFKKYLNSDTDVVAWVDIASFSSEELERLQVFLNISSEQIADLQRSFQETKTTRIYGLGNAAQMVTLGGLAIFESQNPEALEKELKAMPDWAGLKMKIGDRHLLVSTSDALLAEAVETENASEPQVIMPNLAEGLKAHGGRVGVIIALKPEFLRFLESLPGTSDRPDVAKMITAISKLKFACATQGGKNDDFKVEMNFEAADASQSFCRACNQFLRQSVELPADQPLFTTQGTQVILPAENQQALFSKMMAQVVTAGSETNTMNQLRQLALAFHNFESAYLKFPPQALCDNQGNKLLSWRVLMLPFLEQQKLYEQFKLDEPWDSAHNRQLIAKMPEVFASGNRQRRNEQMKQGVTCFQAPMTADTIMGRPGDPMTFTDLKDGSSNTILFVEVLPEYAVPWTKPEDWMVDSENPLKGVVGEKTKTFLMARADGSVQKVTSRISAKAFNGLLTVDGGEIIPNPIEEEED